MSKYKLLKAAGKYQKLQHIATYLLYDSSHSAYAKYSKLAPLHPVLDANKYVFLAQVPAKNF